MRTSYVRLGCWTKPLEGKASLDISPALEPSPVGHLWLCCPCLRLPTASHHEPVLQLCFWLPDIQCSKLSIPDVCLKIILIIFLLFSVKVVWPQWRMKLLLYSCKKKIYFLFPCYESQMRSFYTWRTFLSDSDVSTAIFEKKIHPDVKASKSSSIALPGLCSSQVLCWFQSIGEQSRTWCTPPMGLRAQDLPLSPLRSWGLASRDSKLLGLRVGGEGGEYSWRRARPGQGGWDHLWRSGWEMGQERESWGR